MGQALASFSIKNIILTLKTPRGKCPFIWYRDIIYQLLLCIIHVDTLLGNLSWFLIFPPQTHWILNIGCFIFNGHSGQTVTHMNKVQTWMHKVMRQDFLLIACVQICLSSHTAGTYPFKNAHCPSFFKTVSVEDRQKKTKEGEVTGAPWLLQQK